MAFTRTKYGYTFRNRRRRVRYSRRNYRGRRRYGRVHRPMRRNQGLLSVKQCKVELYSHPAEALTNDWIPEVASFKLEDIDPVQLAAWQRCFNQFRINYVTVVFMPIGEPVLGPNETQLSTFYTAITSNAHATNADWITEQNALTTSNVRTNLTGSFEMKNNGKVKVGLKPRTHYLIQNPGSPLVGKALAPANQWLNINADVTTEHMGLRFGWQYDQAHPLMEYKVLTTLFIQFRNVV